MNFKSKDGLEMSHYDKLTLSKMKKMESKQHYSESKPHDNTFKMRSKSIAHGAMFTDIKPSEIIPSDHQDEQDLMNRSSRDILSLKNSKYMK